MASPSERVGAERIVDGLFGTHRRTNIGDHMPEFTSIDGGFKLSNEDRSLVNKQRAITKTINDKFIQVGAVFLKSSGKMPFDGDWFSKGHRDTDLQSWIDDAELSNANVGFNLQFGWLDVDIDAEDAYFNECVVAALDHLGVDTRFRFGRRSVGFPTHVLVQLAEEESANFENLTKFEPREFRIGEKRYHVQLRSYPTGLDKKNLERSAKQTVMPGSIYMNKKDTSKPDPSVWYINDQIATDVRRIAATTPRRASFNQIVRAIAFGTLLYVVSDHWVEGSRQTTATKVAGWLARVVQDGFSINNHEALAADVFCPVDSDDIAESLISFICDFLGDDEKHMRIRAFGDAREKLDRNPDAKIPGWPAIEQLLGAPAVNALRTTFTPGSDVSLLTKMAERYAYDDTDNVYIDRDRHRSNHETFTHDPGALERRHINETVSINGKPRNAFRMFETSQMRIRVAGRNLYPDYAPGALLRIDSRGVVVSDDDEGPADTIFNTWRGWPIQPANSVPESRAAKLDQYFDRLLSYLTCDNRDQIEWVKDWIAWTFQHPGDKQQIAWVVVGGQGVGKSFMGNTFMASLMGALWGSSSASIIDGKFNVGPFINKMFVFVDEVKFHNESGTDEVKKLIRNVDVPGMLKYGEGQNFKVYARLMFASNTFDMAIGQRSVIDRALFYTRAYDGKHLGMTDAKFRAWSETLKPWFEEFAAELRDMSVREYFVHLFMNRPVSKQAIESIRFSSGNDPDIMGANMRPSRRFAKEILEEGRIIEDLSLESPFTMAQLGNRIVEIANVLNTRPVRTDLVLAEWQEAGLLERSGMTFIFKYRHATLLKLFGDAISTELARRYEFTADDEGDNTEPHKRKAWRGMKKDMRF